MLIKSGSEEGAWVEARGNDIVYVENLGIATLKEDDGALIITTPCGIRRCVRDADITLVHRPFADGDPVEYLDIGAERSYWVKHPNLTLFDIRQMEEDDKQPFIARYKGTTMRQRFRHSDPALRDSPLYGELRQSRKDQVP